MKVIGANCHACFSEDSCNADKIVKAVESGDIAKIVLLAPTLNCTEVCKGLSVAKDYKTFAALSKYYFTPNFQNKMYQKALIASNEGETAEQRAEAIAICMHISGLSNPRELLLTNLLCAARFGKYDMFLAYTLQEGADYVIKTHNIYIYDVACNGNCKSIIDYMEKTRLIEDDDYCYDEIDYVSSRCFWAVYRDEKSAWMTEVNKLIKNGSDPRIYSFIDSIRYEDTLDRPHFVADKWYFFKMFFELKLTMDIIMDIIEIRGRLDEGIFVEVFQQKGSCKA